MFVQGEEGLNGEGMGVLWWREARPGPCAGSAMIHSAISWMEGFG